MQSGHHLYILLNDTNILSKVSEFILTRWRSRISANQISTIQCPIRGLYLYRAYGTEYHAKTIFWTIIRCTTTAPYTTLIWWWWNCCWRTCIRLITATSSCTELRKLSFFSEFEQKNGQKWSKLANSQITVLKFRFIIKHKSIHQYITCILSQYSTPLQRQKTLNSQSYTV